MYDETTRDNESPATTVEEQQTQRQDGFDVRYQPTGRLPRKLVFEPTADGYYRATHEWTGCTWRETGYEHCDSVAIEFGDELPPTVVAAVLERLFNSAFESGTITDVDVLNAIARDTFESELVADALAATNGGVTDGA